MTAQHFPYKAMILAAGLGTRMKPLTDRMPKPMVPVLNVTLIDRVLNWAQHAGVKEVVVNSFYMAEMLEAHLAARSRPAIIISREEVLLETGGGIYKALGMLGEGAFFSANSDTLCIDGKTPALQRMASAWKDDAMDALLLLQPREKAVGYDGKGDFFIEQDGCLRRRGDASEAPYVFTGVQMLHPRLFDGAPSEPFSMNLLYNKGMTHDGRLSPRISALVHDGHWLHVGDPEGLALAEQWLTDNA